MRYHSDSALFRQVPKVRVCWSWHRKEDPSKLRVLDLIFLTVHWGTKKNTNTVVQHDAGCSDPIVRYSVGDRSSGY